MIYTEGIVNDKKGPSLIQICLKQLKPALGLMTPQQHKLNPRFISSAVSKSLIYPITRPSSTYNHLVAHRITTPYQAPCIFLKVPKEPPQKYPECAERTAVLPWQVVATRKAEDPSYTSAGHVSDLPGRPFNAVKRSSIR